jgi:hypothetical protein
MEMSLSTKKKVIWGEINTAQQAIDLGFWPWVMACFPGEAQK